MNAATQLAQAATSAPAGRNASHAPFDGDRAEDLYAIWNSIFERARPVDASPEGSHLSTAGGRPPEGGAGAGDAARDAVSVLEPVDHSLVRAAAGRGADTGAIQEGAAARLSPRPWSGANTDAVPDSPRATALPVTAQRETNFGIATTVRARTGPQGALPPDGSSPGGIAPANVVLAESAESVNVFVRGVAIAIVVRDAAISDQEAVRCAFETARALTGERTGLQELTLNGRTLYRQQGDSSLPASHLVFAC